MAEITKLVINRGGSQNPIKYKNGDIFDSTADFFDSDGNNVFHTDHVSTIPSKLLFGVDQITKHGIISTGDYCGIWCNNSMLGWHFAFFQTQYYDQVNSHDDLTEEMMTFVSIKENPSMNNKYKISEVCFHDATWVNNGSEGCQTVYPDDWAEILKLGFVEKQKLFITITVVDGWQPPTA